ncbi:hypothetical protein IH922_05905 [candidate division KSB1 bacterium]|nr:hypothetical protein [candidate division KSB1 bacterium]
MCPGWEHHRKGHECGHHCPNTGYVFNDAPDALCDAVRAKGWTAIHEIGIKGQGDLVIIWMMGKAGFLKEIGRVENDFETDEGHRGQAAL